MKLLKIQGGAHSQTSDDDISPFNLGSLGSFSNLGEVQLSNNNKFMKGKELWKKDNEINEVVKNYLPDASVAISLRLPSDTVNQIDAILNSTTIKSRTGLIKSAVNLLYDLINFSKSGKKIIVIDENGNQHYELKF